MKFERIPFRSDRYDQACQLRHELLRRPLGLDLFAEDLAAESAYRHYGMIEEDRVVACALAVPVTPEKAKIRQMAVAVEYQNQGTGRQLLRNMELDLKQQGVKSLELEARSTAVGFYEKLDYKKEGDEFLAVSIPHVKMVKSLVQE
ncbi:ribosomal-protein-alanine N-acetyltransferase [Gimesia alba]|uniref:Ribosomal-protein-alanine N-acetyltransferase n=1 Tax=Gimesia alba TaxID=2527973 RepID=A0A517RBZ4_9PLAN|nr:GNAT family N-acetyltransferase [Gimesia alba]QDT41408.1 ribosomal-protein-alanine N-acetyltransferase [Gimesia alba]